MTKNEKVRKVAAMLVRFESQSDLEDAMQTLVKQDPSGGKKAKFGSIVTIFVPPNGNVVPNVVGQNYQVALGNLSNAGFTNIQVVHVPNPQLANGTVVLQNPKAGHRVPANTQITLSVVQNAASPSPTPTSASPSPSPSPSPSSTGP